MKWYAIFLSVHKTVNIQGYSELLEPIKTLSTDLVNTNVYYLTCGVYFGVRACDIFSLFRWLMLILEYFSYKGGVVVMAARWHILMDEGTTEKHLEIEAEMKICKRKKDYFNI